MHRNVQFEGVHADSDDEANQMHEHMCEYISTLERVDRRQNMTHVAGSETPVVQFEGVKLREVEVVRPGQPEKGNRGSRGKTALRRAITRTAGYLYHNPNATDVLIPTGSSAICGCEESWITASYCAAGRRGSRAPNRQVI